MSLYSITLLMVASCVISVTNSNLSRIIVVNRRLQGDHGYIVSSMKIASKVAVKEKEEGGKIDFRPKNNNKRRRKARIVKRKRKRNHRKSFFYSQFKCQIWI